MAAQGAPPSFPASPHGSSLLWLSFSNAASEAEYRQSTTAGRLNAAGTLHADLTIFLGFGMSCLIGIPRAIKAGSPGEVRPARPPPLRDVSLCSSWVGLFFFTAASLFTRASLHRPERLALATSLRVPLHVVAQAMMHVHATRFVSLPESTACSLVWQGTAAFELLLVWLFWLAMYSVAAATPLALAGLVQLLGTALFTTANPGMCASARDICPGSAARYVRTARQLQTLCRLTVVTPSPGGESIRDGQAHAACMAVLTFSEILVSLVVFYGVKFCVECRARRRFALATGKACLAAELRERQPSLRKLLITAPFLASLVWPACETWFLAQL